MTFEPLTPDQAGFALGELVEVLAVGVGKAIAFSRGEFGGPGEYAVKLDDGSIVEVPTGLLRRPDTDPGEPSS